MKELPPDGEEEEEEEEEEKAQEEGEAVADKSEDNDELPGKRIAESGVSTSKESSPSENKRDQLKVSEHLKGKSTKTCRMPFLIFFIFFIFIMFMHLI